jgi:UDP-N-acetylglucosamine--N-acetylmuramyl-(pentapeptide) pyrophosphoryl-undecaprenol N-acetylglucosamine transferase
VRVLIAGGGTGGHLYPGIALARELTRRDPATQVSFVGTAQGIEARVVPREGFPLDLIRVAGLKGKSKVDRLRGLALLPIAAIDAGRVVLRQRPDVVVGVGGFASGPVLAFAALAGYPTMLLEQNALPGVTNRLLARFVRAAAVNFEAALAYFPGTGFVAGNPVRPEFFPAQNEEANDPFDSIDAARGLDLTQGGPAHAGKVLIFGGSQGAHAINLAMVEAAARLAATGLRLAITHQTGERDLDLVRDAYQRAGLEARVEAFIYQIDREMKAADLVICRAGATTLAELAASETPAILVPLPNSTDDHQRKNAEVFGAAGAAVVIEERELQASLGDVLQAVLGSPERQRQMSAAAKLLARPDAAARIADRVESLAGVKGRDAR